jgi:hypothetical protein
MTTETFAHLLEARRAGRGRWQARCPAHRDRHPSLSIREGRGGRVLLHCFAGCDLSEILTALCLGKRHLFPATTASPQVLMSVRSEHERRLIERIVRTENERHTIARERKLHALVVSIGARLMGMNSESPEANALSSTYHNAIAQLRITAGAERHE